MNNFWICLSLTAFLVFLNSPLSARGGGRGGGGGIPSMSRAASRPAVSPQRSAPKVQSQANRRVMSQTPKQSRPSSAVAAQRKQSVISVNSGRTPSMSNLKQRQAAAGTENQVNIRDAAKQYQGRKPFYGDISKVPQARQDNVRAALPQKFQGQKVTASRVGDNVRRNHPQSKDWFSQGFYARHDFTPNFDFRGNVWSRMGWNDLNSWLGYGWSYPYYYDYGYPVELTSGYESYSPPASESAPSAEGQWLSLGVFAVGKTEAQAAYSSVFLQLAIDKQGNIAGTYYNATTDQTRPLEGYVDKKTQAAFWRLSDKPDSPMMSTGIFNLTQDAAPVTVAFSSTNEQNWVLVRVNEGSN